MRLVQMKLEPEHVPAFHRNYDEKVIPLLRDTPGCLYASLLSSTHAPGDCISFTLWDKPQSAEHYEHGGLFDRLMDGVNEYLAPSSEWRVHLTENLTMEYNPVPEAPRIDAYEIALTDQDKSIPAENALFVRIVAPELRPDMAPEFQHIYNTEILPVLRGVPGFRNGYLSRNDADHSKFLSITLWDSGAQAAAYESSGLFRRLTDRMKHTFSDIYQWKMQMQNEKRGQTPVAEHLSVEGYAVITGKRFV
ncbi:MAG TPA: antibiotic biosynthesis monooxygenase [Bacteroidota bacterium]|nr:antibiotic biosynthesis monooxygenase [Bacteroidota bacterium]